MALGKLTARHRLDLLLDRNSLLEFGQLAGLSDFVVMNRSTGRKKNSSISFRSIIAGGTICTG